MSNATIKIMQKGLSALGFYKGELDGEQSDALMNAFNGYALRSGCVPFFPLSEGGIPLEILEAAAGVKSDVPDVPPADAGQGGGEESTVTEVITEDSADAGEEDPAPVEVPDAPPAEPETDAPAEEQK